MLHCYLPFWSCSMEVCWRLSCRTSCTMATNSSPATMFPAFCWGNRQQISRTSNVARSCSFVANTSKPIPPHSPTSARSDTMVELKWAMIHVKRTPLGQPNNKISAECISCTREQKHPPSLGKWSVNVRQFTVYTWYIPVAQGMFCVWLSTQTMKAESRKSFFLIVDSAPFLESSFLLLSSVNC